MEMKRAQNRTVVLEEASLLDDIISSGPEPLPVDELLELFETDPEQKMQTCSCGKRRRMVCMPVDGNGVRISQTRGLGW